MIEHELKKLNTLSKETLSNNEKAQLRAYLVRTIQSNPYFEAVPLYQRALQHGLPVMLSTFIFMIFVAGSVSVVADNALPGDPLYAFKINVNEGLRERLLNTSEKKVAYQTNRIDTRLNEIKTLAESKTLTKAKQVTVQNALDAHITAISKELDGATPTDALKVTTTLEESLKAQKASVALSIAADTTTNAEAGDILQVYDSALQKVSDQEFQIISKEVDTLQNDILTTTDPSLDATTSTSTDSNVTIPITTPSTTPVAP